MVLSEKIEDYFLPGGKLAKMVPGFKYRSEQHRLANSVARVLENDEFLVAEVGTGVGKTFGYLIPAVFWSLTQKEKVVISTRTRALQQQLTEKDIPLIHSNLDNHNSFAFAEAKGRENYLCWNKYISILAGRKRLEPHEQKFIDAILTWAESTRIGDKKELNLDSNMMKNWELVASDRQTCRKDDCLYRDKCFRLKMLKRLEKADIIVINHALLLADISVNHSILPDYSYLIIDEAHTFARESFDHLSCRFSFYDNLRILDLLFIKGNGFEKGLIPHLKRKYSSLHKTFDEISDLVSHLKEQLRLLLASLHPLLSSNEAAYILEEADQEAEWFPKVFSTYCQWMEYWSILEKHLNRINRQLPEDEEASNLFNLTASLQEESEKLYYIFEESLNRHDAVTWVEMEKQQPTALVSSVLNNELVLGERLYNKLKSLVMVSATLTVENKFDFFIKKTGLSHFQLKGQVLTLLEKSPFAFEKQARLFTVDDLPYPWQPEFPLRAANAVTSVLEVVRGHVLILFTARKQLHDFSLLLRPYCQEVGLDLLVQDEDGTFSYVLERYMSSPNTVLMGLDTFWEGVDLKGDLLKCVIIVKLPFRSPNEPYSRAWEKYYSLNNGNSFNSFLLPDAVVRLKQGVGRLIRSESDRGAVIVLDNRLERKSYGRVFKNSLPMKNIREIGFRELPGQLREFLLKE
ncbi:MAG: ATP-dependent DNA helicase [Syntrophomonadaceae bacterium]|jgi:ATP-dependent DNA helicase DinG